MNKYIPADKLIAEIENLNLAVPYNSKDRHDDGLHDAYYAVLKHIDSLQQEQPEVDLEKEIEKQIRSTFYDLDGIAIMGTSKYASVEDMEYIARHFYELGLNTRKEDTK